MGRVQIAWADVLGTKGRTVRQVHGELQPLAQCRTFDRSRSWPGQTGCAMWVRRGLPALTAAPVIGCINAHPGPHLVCRACRTRWLSTAFL